MAKIQIKKIGDDLYEGVNTNFRGSLEEAQGIIAPGFSLEVIEAETEQELGTEQEIEPEKAAPVEVLEFKAVRDYARKVFNELMSMDALHTDLFLVEFTTLVRRFVMEKQ